MDLETVFKYATKRGVAVVNLSKNNFDLKIDEMLPENDPIFRTKSREYKQTYSTISKTFPEDYKMLIIISFCSKIHCIHVDEKRGKHFTTDSTDKSDIVCWLIVDACRARGHSINRTDIETTCMQTENEEKDSNVLLLFFALARALGKTRTFRLAQIKRNCSSFLTKFVNTPETIFRERRKPKQ